MRHASQGNSGIHEDTIMKIQVIKKSDKNANKHSGCAFVVEQLLEPRT